MSFNTELIAELVSNVVWLFIGILVLAGIYIAVSLICYSVWYLVWGRNAEKGDFVGRKTVTFGDESAITPNRVASFASVISLFLFWGIFTGSVISPLHVPAPYEGRTEFTYTVKDSAGKTQDANVIVDVTPRGQTAENKPEKAALSGLAAADYKSTNVRIPTSIRALDNDAAKGEGLDIVAINGTPVDLRGSVDVGTGEVVYTPNKRLFYKPNVGWQMDPVYLPSPEKVWSRFIEIASTGYRGFTLAEHVGYSLMRVLVGFFLGVLFGVPLGFAMGLNSWLRGWFDPIVEFMRPVPPLALIPLIIIWFGIGENGKMILLFLASLWIMTIAARSGVSGVAIQKVHAAYSLGASKWQTSVEGHLPQRPAGHLHRRACLNGRLLGHGGRRRTRRRLAGCRHDDHGRVEIYADRYRYHGDHRHRRDRLLHRHPDALGRKQTGPVEGTQLGLVA